MTLVFSTIVNFTLKGLLEKIIKFQYISSSECDSKIFFPRVKHRFLQIRYESAKTFLIPSMQDMVDNISQAKEDAINTCKSCGMNLDTYDDASIAKSSAIAVETAVKYDCEQFESFSLENSERETEHLPHEEALFLREDLSLIKLRKSSSLGLPTYGIISDSSKGSSAKQYVLSSAKKTARPFMVYEGSYIHKSTALYLLQENCQILNDRLMCVRSEQPKHIFSGQDKTSGRQT